MTTYLYRFPYLPVGRLLAAVILAAAAQWGIAASSDTDISNVPLFTSSSTNVKPNLMYILDDSGSMKSDYIPDEANFSTTKYGKLTSQCNGVAYNPDQAYVLPVDSTGKSASLGSKAILSLDPNTQLTNQNKLATPSSLTVPTATTPLTVTITSGLSSKSTALYAVGETVTIFSTASTTTFMVGTVTSWNILTTGTKKNTSTTGTLVVDITSNTGTGTLSTGLLVAPGQPTSSAYYYKYTGSEKALGYTYTSSGVITGTNFYTECNSAAGTLPSKFTRVTVTDTSSEAQNYANWYAYYRTRILMAKSSLSLVFNTLDNKYRVGYTTISDDTVTESNDFLDIRDFDADQKASFFKALNAATPGSFTPLRGALSKAGHYYAKLFPGQTYDPVQYACQKNFTLLSTDGYWNTQDETTTYGPYGLNGKNVGNLDSYNAYPTGRPKYDGGKANGTQTTTWSTTQTVVTSDATVTKAYSNLVGTRTGTYVAKSGNSAGSTSTLYAPLTNSYSVGTCTGTSSKTCTVTVTTSAPHGLTGTAKVLIAGASGGNNASLFNKSFDLLATPAASGSTYTISVTGFTTGTTGNGLLPPTTPGYTVPQGGCSNSNGNPRYLFPGIITQTDNYTQTLVDTTTATVIEDTSFSNTQSVVKTTPYTLIETTVNGVVTQPGTPTAGTASFGSPTSLPSTANTSKNLGTQTVDTSAGVASDFAVVTTIKTSKCFTSLPGTNPAVASISSSSYVTPAPTYTPTTVQPNTPSAQPTPSNVIVSTTAEIEVVGSRSTVINITSTNGGSTDSLADVSFYYFNTDLRNKALWDNCTGSLGTDVCGSSASFPKQNMLTMTLGLGASGLLAYKKDYMTQQSAGSGDYYRIKNGLADWPIPANGKGPENIDDLWHAAINGTDFGTTAIPVANPNTQYFSASNAKDLVDSLTIALSNVTAMLGSSSAAATSTLQPVTGDNDVFVAKFTSVQWTGDVQRLSINPDTGVLSKTPTWSAADMLEKRDLAATPRKVLYARSGRSDLLEFSYGNLNTDNLSQYFDNFCKKKGAGGNSAPSQCALMVDQTAANTGSNLIAYLTGGKDDNYRARNSRLGDVVNGAPLFVGIPKFKYADSGYSTFVGSTRQGYCSSTSTAGSTTRQGTVYVGANDGMLHAFDRCDGSEKWAYIPKMVMPNMYTIADNAYINNHQFFVDGAPVSGDIFDGTSWKTILVGGLNAGGKGYYALDITDPANPKALWEFTDSNNANLGLTFGNPIITKRASDKKWVVVFSSGYNNAANGGDGNGHLLMVDANTGDLVLDMPTVDYTTPVVASGTPSGLAKLNAWVEEESDNTALRYYGGDLAGNVWRFDTEGLTAPKNKSFRLAQLQVSGTPQPVTTEPELAQVSFHGANYAVVYVGTGSYLGMTDLATNGTQTIYAIKDDLGLVSLGDVRAGKTLIAQTLTTNNAIRKATTNAVDWSTKNGWYVDMPSTGERVNVSMLIAYNVLSVASTVPSNSPCESGGTSWLYKLDIASGSAVSNATDNAAGLMLQEGTLIVGQTVVQLTNGDATTISTQSSGDLRSDSEKAPSMDSVLRRTSWRELAN